MDLTYSEQFKEYIEFSRYIGHMQTVYKFPNGFGASVIEIYYYEEDYIEVAVVKFDKNGEYRLDYSTPITDDVIVVTDIEERDNVLQQICDLEKSKEE